MFATNWKESWDQIGDKILKKNLELIWKRSEQISSGCWEKRQIPPDKIDMGEDAKSDRIEFWVVVIGGLCCCYCIVTVVKKNKLRQFFPTTHFHTTRTNGIDWEEINICLNEDISSMTSDFMIGIWPKSDLVCMKCWWICSYLCWPIQVFRGN